MIAERKIARINGIALDVVVSENPEFSSEVTSYPVEDGDDASEHIHNLPIGVSIEAVVSGTPHGAVADERGDDPITQVRAALEDLRAARVPFVYEGLRHVYRSMVFESLSMPFDASTGHALRISASLRRFNVVELVRVAARLRPSPKSDGKPVWLCPSFATTGLFLGIAGAKEVTPGSDASANKRAGCRRIVRRNGEWVFADNGKKLSQAELDEALKQNTGFKKNALPFFAPPKTPPTGTFAPTPQVIRNLSENQKFAIKGSPSFGDVGSSGSLRESY